MTLDPAHDDASSVRPQHRGLVLLTVEADADVAGERRDALVEAGIDAELHIEDGASFSPTSSVYPTGSPFVYVLFVPRAQREEAAATLIDAGWDGRRSAFAGGRPHVGAGFALRGALVALLAGAAVVVALLLLRGA